MIRHYALRGLSRFDTLAFFVCVVFFLIWPDFDLYVSNYFFDANQGGFFWKNHALVKGIYASAHIVGLSLLISLPILIAASWILKKKLLVERRKALIFLLCASILGPGLLVNFGLKGNWERPRPRQVIEFNGDKQYESPFAPSFNCASCRSFVSGHASVGFLFFSLALLARRKRWLIGSALAGAIIGAGRIAQGGHFFSDILFSGWVVWFSSLILYTLFYKVKPFAEPEPAYEPVLEQ